MRSGHIIAGLCRLLAAAFLFDLGLSAAFTATPLRWEAQVGYRFAPVPAQTAQPVRLTRLGGGATGIVFTNRLSYEAAEKNQNLLNGAGVAAGDFDGDGWCDLYFCNIEGENRLYRNLGGWRFQDVTAAAAVACTNMHSHGAVFADVNGDRALDLLVCSISGPNRLFLNDGRGHFTALATFPGERSRAGSHSMALADVDGDGDLDLYVANYGENSILRSGGTVSIRTIGGKPVVTGRYRNRIKIINGQLIELGEPDVLYRNDGHGRFSGASWTDGTFRDEDGKPTSVAPMDMSLSVMFRDLNNDGAPDIYTCSDFQGPDRIWINDGHGRFAAIAPEAVRTTSQFSMGVDFADVDRDGWDDFFLTDMLSPLHRLRMTQIDATNPAPEVTGQTIDRYQAHHNALLWNRGDATYAEIANLGRVAESDWSWTPAFLDVDLDGYEDLLVTTGHAYDTLNADASDSRGTPKASRVASGTPLKSFPPLRVPNRLFRNRGDRTFEEVGTAWGFDSLQVSQGLALADLDNDGDLDVVVNCLNDQALIYRNDAAAPRLAVRLKGRPPNTAGIGAQIRVRGGPVPQNQEMICGGRYASGDEALRVFAAGSATNRLSIEVRWRNGAVSRIADARPNAVYEIDETTAQAGPPLTQTAPRAEPFFADVSDRVRYSHHENNFNEQEQQAVLSRGLSRLGPGVAWFDLDGDGTDELIIGSGNGGWTGIFRNTSGQFQRVPVPSGMVEDGDQTGMAGWTAAGGAPVLLVGHSNYEGARSGTTVEAWQLGPDGPSRSPLPLQKFDSSRAPMTGPVAVADYDADGDLDVFVGGRAEAGHYPAAVSSWLLRNENGELQPDTKNNPPFRQVGLVSGAVFSDLDGDGFPELILACDWGPVRVFANEGGVFHERTAPLGLARQVGWWNSVATGDLDGDGRPDIVAGNWGLNSPFHASPEHPLRLFYGDFLSTGRLQLIDATDDEASGGIVPRWNRTWMSAALPFLLGKFPDHHAYSTATVSDLLGDQFRQAREVQAVTLASTVFFNRGNRFEPKPLPQQAQFAPVFGVNIADLDGDGLEDVFLAQNFFDTHPALPRLDAGRGLWLRGVGGGQLVPVPGAVSGIRIYGEQRGSAVADFNGDGRIDLAVAENHDAVRLFLNQQARPGLRIRLHGPPLNPAGIGAVLRLGNANGWGPTREVHGGSGYWSQDSAVLVMNLPERPERLQVRWPGGKTVEVPLPTEAREIRVGTDGLLPAR